MSPSNKVDTGRIVGIDYSMSSPSMVIHEGTREWSADSCRFFYTTKKPENASSNPAFHWFRYPKFSNDSERFTSLAAQFSEHLLPTDRCFIEGYSMGSVGRLASIGENTGFLKSACWTSHRIHFEAPAPMAIKKFATGSGSADKISMYNAFVAENPHLDIYELANLKRTKTSKGIEIQNVDTISDMIDAYFVCKWGFFENLKMEQTCESSSSTDPQDQEKTGSPNSSSKTTARTRSASKKS